MVKIVKDSVKEFFEKLGTGAAGVLAGFMVFAITVAAFSSQAELDRIDELITLGYSDEVILDQIAEEFEKHDGLHHTGGIDGKYLNGTIAPNGSLAGSENGSGAGSQNQTPSHSHSYKETSRVEATCTSKGKITKTCDCGDTKTESIPIVDHNYVAGKVIAATCIEKGRTELVCTGCGDTYWVDTTYADHIYVPSEGTDATCTEDGTKVKTCSVCGDTITTAIPAQGHKEKLLPVVKTEATCEAGGLIQYECVHCNIVLREEETSPKGHIKSIILIVDEMPTFAKDGVGSYRCTGCDKVMETVVLPKEDMPMAVYIVGGCTAVLLIVAKGKRRKR